MSQGGYLSSGVHLVNENTAMLDRAVAPVAALCRSRVTASPQCSCPIANQRFRNLSFQSEDSRQNRKSCGDAVADRKLHRVRPFTSGGVPARERSEE